MSRPGPSELPPTPTVEPVAAPPLHDEPTSAQLKRPGCEHNRHSLGTSLSGDRCGRAEGYDYIDVVVALQ